VQFLAKLIERITDLFRDRLMEDLSRDLHLELKTSSLPMIAGSAFPRWWEGRFGGQNVAIRRPGGHETEIYAGQCDEVAEVILVRPAPGKKPLQAGEAQTEFGGGAFQVRMFPTGKEETALRVLPGLERELEALPAAVQTVSVHALGVDLRLSREAGNKGEIIAAVKLGAAMAEMLRNAEPAIVRVVRSRDEGELHALLAGGESADAMASTGESALALAILAGWHQGVEALLERGADVSAGSAPAVVLAAHRGDLRLLGRLEALGAGPHGTARGGVTPLMAAAAEGHREAVRWLLERGADPVGKDVGGKTALDRARGRGHRDVVDVLQEAGAWE
jgi:hypothetical protein